jgi:hypothetical protein
MAVDPNRLENLFEATVPMNCRTKCLQFAESLIHRKDVIRAETEPPR